MNIPFLMFAILLITSFLDYGWEPVFSKSASGRASKFKIFLSIVLVGAGFVMMFKQISQDRETDQKTARIEQKLEAANNKSSYIEQQLAVANQSLTNAMVAMRGLSDGGDSFADPYLDIDRDALPAKNLLKLCLQVSGNYPVRNITVEVSSETEASVGSANGIAAVKHTPTIRHIGDLYCFWWNESATVCDIPLSEETTNIIRVKITEINGSVIQRFEAHSIPNGWYVQNLGQVREIEGVKTIDLPNNSGDFLPQKLYF